MSTSRQLAQHIQWTVEGELARVLQMNDSDTWFAPVAWVAAAELAMIRSWLMQCVHTLELLDDPVGV